MSSETPQQSGTLHFLDYWRVIRSRKEIVVAVALLVVITGTVYTWMLPNIYAAASQIKISSDEPQIDPFSGTQTYFVYNPYFLQTQVELMQARPIFETVISRLDLQTAWGDGEERMTPERTLKVLQSYVDFIPSRDTPIVTIAVRCDDPAEAAKIANAFADVYRDSRLEFADRDMRNAISKMKEELAEQSNRVRSAEEKLQAIRIEFDIAIPGGEGNISIDEYQMQQVLSESLRAQQGMIEKKVVLDILENLNDEDLAQRAATLAADPSVMDSVRMISDIDAELSAMRAEYGPNHPEVKRFINRRQTETEILKKNLEALRASLLTEYEKEKAKYEASQEWLAEVRAETIELQGERYRPFRQALADLDTERLIYNQLSARIQQEIITRNVPRNPVEIFERAEPEARPVSPDHFLNVLLSILVGLGAGVGLAYFIEYLDTSIKTSEDIERILGLPVLGLIPQKVRPLIEEGPDSEHAEAYRVLRTNLAFTEGGSNRGAFCVLSSGAGEGKSTTVFNLAYVCAQQGEKVLLVDADLRRPVQHTILGVSNRFGLTNVLLRDVPVEEAIKATSVPNLHFLPSGRLPRTSLGVLDPKRIGELVSSLKQKYDVVFIDTPPLVGISDSSIIAKETDGAVIVVQYRKYPRDMLMKAKQMIEALGVTVVGAVLNNINVMRDDYYYYYHSYYSDYYRSSQSEQLPENEL